jgi:hypothetical protein
MSLSFNLLNQLLVLGFERAGLLGVTSSFESNRAHRTHNG